MLPEPRDVRVFLALLCVGAGIGITGRVLADGGSGWGWSLVALGAAAELAALWCLLLAAAPGLVRTLTVGAVSAALAGSLLACWIVQARETARQQKAVDNLRRIGAAAHEQFSLHPGADPYRQPR